MSAEDIRAFVAAEVPADLQRRIWEAFAAQHGSYSGLRWVPAENLHLTVKFLGNVSGDRVPELMRAIRHACAGHRPFRVSLAGAGVFPPRGAPRVLWIGVAAGSAELTALAADTDRQLGKRGIERERRPFSAHLTLARSRRDASGQDLTQLVSRFEGVAWGELELAALTLMRSHLGPAGARYERLGEVPLGKDQS